MTSDLNTVLVKVARRADTARDSVLREAFVPIPALMAHLESPQHHVLFGRRGTGKTHVLRYLRDVQAVAGNLPVYIDLRRIGSPEDILARDQRGFVDQTTALLVDLIEYVHNAVYEQVLTDLWVDRLNEISDGLDALAVAATKIQVVGDTEVEQQHETQSQNGTARSAELSLSRDGRLGWKNDRQDQRSRRKLERKVSRGRETRHVLLGPLASAIQALAAALEPTQMWLLLDEWSALPVDLQPLVADLLRRTFFAAPGVVVKVSAVHGRSRFTDAESIAAPRGLELGADTAASLDLDDFLLFRNDTAATIDFYASLIFRHFAATAVRADRPDHGLPAGVQTPNELIEHLFADRAAFHNLILGAEGVPRDTLQIAGLAAGAAHHHPITATHVAAATRDYFLRDKQGHLPKHAQAVFANLAEQCVRQKSRIIPLRRDRESHEDAIQRLYDARLIHRVRQGVSLDPQHPTEVYDVYVLDYGCFLGLLRDGRIRGPEAGLDPGARFANTNEIEIRARSFVRFPIGWYRQRADQRT